MSGKRLIVNADDFGRTAGINRGILAAHAKGIVTSTTMMVNYPAAVEAAQMAGEYTQLGLGLHLALTGGAPTLPAERVRTLVDGEGRLPARPDGLAGADPAEVLAEARAQLARFRALVGRDPTHFDSHHHSHRVEAVFEALMTLAWETGLPVRNGGHGMRDRLRKEGVPTTDRFVEGFYGEGATLAHLLQIIDAVEPGTTELMCHPAYVDEELRAGSSYADVRADELAALTHRDARQAVQASGIKLVTFRDL